MAKKAVRKKSAKRRVVKKKTAKKRAVKRTIKRKPVKRVAKRTVKRKTVRRVAKKAAVIKKAATMKTKNKLIGKVTHFFGNLSVAVIELKTDLRVGERIMIEGATTSFEQPVKSMQIDRKDIKAAKKGDDIGMKVKGKVRPGDKVYKVA